MNVGPVDGYEGATCTGHQLRELAPRMGGDRACSGCGYHVCSCPPKREYIMDIGYETVVGKITVVVDPNHVGPPKFAVPSPMPEPPVRVPEWHGNPMPRSMVGRLALLEALAARDPEDPEGPPVFSPEQCAQAIELLLRGEAEGP
jgi:hypothetical protein